MYEVPSTWRIRRTETLETFSVPEISYQPISTVLDSHQKYKPEKASKSVSLEAMKSLLESLDAEDATKRPEPYARSQDIPISWNKGPVKVRV